MRIRKRQVPLPLSSLSPMPLSDPHLLSLNHCSSSSSSPPLVQPPQQLHDPKPSQQRLLHVGPPHPSDHPNRLLLPPIGASSNNSSRGSDFSWELKKRNYCLEALKEEHEDGSRDEREKKENHTRKGSILGAENVSGFPSESSFSSHRVLGKLFEGEKAFPFKKRRGSIGEATRVEKEKMLTQRKMEKKSDGQQSSDEKKQEDRVVTREGINQKVGSGTSPKKRARGSAIMEGSRCSRVNGRGWRCCQQTLVGYSLCEHHLGKGRLRSLNSVRSRSLASSIGSIETKSKQLSRQSYVERPKDDCKPADMLLDINHRGEDQRQQSENSEEKMPPLVVTKKRMKLGTVKARSMSSLLGQTNSATAVEDENNK